jgi:hypothetical protein
LCSFGRNRPQTYYISHIVLLSGYS